MTTILITGATAGIGRFLALDLKRRGHRVIATGRNAQALGELEREGVETLTLDVTDEASVAAAVQKVGPIDVLVNNAGYGLYGPLEEISDADLRAQFDTNVFGLMNVTRAFLPAMRARGSGRIVNIGSVAGKVTFPLFGAYHASKYAVEAISDALRRELAPFGIQVALVEPGPIKSGFAERQRLSSERYAGPGSPYAAMGERALAYKARANVKAPGPESVARAVRHAIEARRARTRYVMPASSRFVVGLFWLLPDRVADWVFARILRP